MGKGSHHTLLLRENRQKLSGGKLNNINEDKNDLEVPLLGIDSMDMLAKNLQNIFGERAGIPSSILLHVFFFFFCDRGTSANWKWWPFFAPSFTLPERRWSELFD